jgi:hypothetical protein
MTATMTIDKTQGGIMRPIHAALISLEDAQLLIDQANAGAVP